MTTHGTFSRRRFLAGAAAATALVAVPTLVSPAVARSTDSRIVNTSGARLRSGPGTGYAVVASLTKGTEVRYLAYGGSANGYEWHKVQVLSSGKQGFIAAPLLSMPGGSVTGPFTHGQTVWVTAASANMRQQPGTQATVLKVAPKGSQGVVVDGPIAASGYTWYKVTISITTAWMATTTLGAAPPDPGIPYNVRVIDGPVNVRQFPTLSSAVLATVPTGQRGWLTQRTFVEADGHRWAEVQFNVGRIVIGHISTKYVEIT
jgi:uncharacterized protein YgiM (DUF1202 family)